MLEAVLAREQELACHSHRIAYRAREPPTQKMTRVSFRGDSDGMQSTKRLLVASYRHGLQGQFHCLRFANAESKLSTK